MDPLKPRWTPNQMLLQQQLEQARALQQPSGRSWGAGAGGVLGTLGDVLRTGFGASKEKTISDALRGDIAATDAAEAGAAALRKDPNSPESQKMQAQAAALLGDALTPEQRAGITVDNYKDVVQTVMDRAGLQARRDESQATRDLARETAQGNREFQQLMAGGQQAFQAQQARDQRSFLAGQNEADRRLRAQLAADEAERERLKAEKAKGPAQLPASEAALIGESETALKAVDELGKQFDALSAGGWAGKIKAKAGEALDIDTDPATYDALARTTAQVVGTIIEGGKLAAGDEGKYRAMMPVPGDPPELKAAKIESIKKLIQSKKQNRIIGLDNAGFNVQGFTKPATGGSGQPTIDLAAPAGGMVRVSNGKETLEIPASDLADAEKDGYRRVK